MASTVEKPKRGIRSNLLTKFKYKNVHADPPQTHPGCPGIPGEQDYLHTSALTGLPQPFSSRLVPLNLLSETKTVFEPLPCSSGSTISNSVPAAPLLPRPPSPRPLAGRGSRGRGETTRSPKAATCRNLPRVSAVAFCPLPVPCLARALPFTLSCSQGGAAERAPQRAWRRAHKGRLGGAAGADSGGLTGPARPQPTPEASSSWSRAKRRGGLCGGRGAGSLSFGRRLPGGQLGRAWETLAVELGRN